MTDQPVQLHAWDTCVVIDALQRDKKWWPEIETMYKDAEFGKSRILISEVVVTEVCKGKSRSGKKSPEDVLRDITSFFSNQFIARRPVDDRVSVLAAAFIRDHNMGTCDAMIAATACVHGATTLYTRDGLKDNGSRTKLLKLDGVLFDPRRGDAKKLIIVEPNAARFSGAELYVKDKEDEHSTQVVIERTRSLPERDATPRQGEALRLGGKVADAQALGQGKNP